MKFQKLRDKAKMAGSESRFALTTTTHLDEIRDEDFRALLTDWYQSKQPEIATS